MIWGPDRAAVDAQAVVRAAGRKFRVLRRAEVALASAEDVGREAAIDSQDAAFCIVVEVQGD